MKLSFRKPIIVVGLTALFLSVYGIVVAQEGVIVVDSHAEPAQATVGEQILFEVIVKHTLDIEVVLPSAGIEYGGLELLNYTVPDPEEVQDPVLGTVIEERAVYTVAAYDTGSYTIPPAEVRFRSENSENQTILTNDVAVSIVSILPADANDILDIKEPIILVRNLFFLLLLGILIGLILGILIYRRFRKKKEKDAPLNWEKEPDLSPHEEAIDALKRLKGSALLSQGNVKEYYTKLSDIERLYLQRRYVKPILMMTTSETKQSLAGEEMPTDGMNMIDSLLGECDLVKFARFRPVHEANESAWQIAYDIVELTKKAGRRQLSATDSGPEENAQ
jgi:hypothetical protein